MYLVTHNVKFSESLKANSKARFRRHSGATSRKRNAADGPLAARPQGDHQFALYRVAALGNRTTIPCELRLVERELVGSEWALYIGHYTSSPSRHKARCQGAHNQRPAIDQHKQHDDAVADADIAAI